MTREEARLLALSIKEVDLDVALLDAAGSPRDRLERQRKHVVNELRELEWRQRRREEVRR